MTDADRVDAQFTPGNAYSRLVHGGDLGWTWWVPLAWQAAADPSGSHPAPPPPAVMGGDQAAADALGGGGSHRAWWGPFLHLTMFGLGWNRPDLGIQRWLDLGRPTEDPILSVVNRWWAQQDGFIADFLAWAKCSDYYTQLVQSVATEFGTSTKAPNPEFRPTFMPRWFGPADEMHTYHHLMLALQTQPRAEPTLLAKNSTSATESPRATLLLDSYPGWPLHLVSLKLPKSGSPRSWRVDVVCRPMGWLGEYRLSSQTGRWFRGKHTVHQLGC